MYVDACLICVTYTHTQEYLQGVKLLDTVLRNLDHETTVRDDVSHACIHTHGTYVLAYKYNAYDKD